MTRLLDYSRAFELYYSTTPGMLVLSYTMTAMPSLDYQIVRLLADPFTPLLSYVVVYLMLLL